MHGALFPLLCTPTTIVPRYCSYHAIYPHVRGELLRQYLCNQMGMVVDVYAEDRRGSYQPAGPLWKGQCLFNGIGSV